MKVGIIGAMEEEIRLLKESLLDLRVVHAHGYEFMEGRLGAHEVVLVQSGIGKVNAAISTTLLVEHFQVELLMNTGTAGALDPHLQVGDLVIANSLAYHDVDVTGFGYEPGQMAGMPAAYYPNTYLMRLVQKVGQSQGIKARLGQIVSGDEFVNQSDRIQSIQATFPKARACEMESTAIAQTAHVLGVPYVIVRAISDHAQEEAAMSFDEFVLLAGRASAGLVLAFLEALPVQVEL